MVVKFVSVRGAKLLLRHNNNKICQQEEEEEEEEEERETVGVNSIYTRRGGRTHCSISQRPSHTYECKGTISFSRYLFPDL